MSQASLQLIVVTAALMYQETLQLTVATAALMYQATLQLIVVTGAAGCRRQRTLVERRQQRHRGLHLFLLGPPVVRVPLHRDTVSHINGQRLHKSIKNGLR